jgi:hypothetical protein
MYLLDEMECPDYAFQSIMEWAIYLSECDIRVEKLALEVQKKFQAKNKKSEASDDIQEVIQRLTRLR